VRAVRARSGLAGADIGTVVMGNVIQAGTKMNPARQARRSVVACRWRCRR
jgi:acetyl-CoA C-acetyltransferase